MRDVVQILVNRDGISEEDAKAWLNETMESVYDYLKEGNTQGAEDIFTSTLGLEPDYLLDVLM